MTSLARLAVMFGAPIALVFCAGDRFAGRTDPSTAGSASDPGGSSTGASAGAAGVAPSGGRDGLAGASTEAGEASTDGGASEEPDSAPVTIAVPIQNDADDAVFVRGEDEQLKFDMTVGTAEAWRIGLIFRISIPKGSRVEHAALVLERTGGDASADDTLRVEIYESSNVPGFDTTHMHRPEAHVSGGLWESSVGGFRVGNKDQQVESPELRTLLEHVLSRDDYRGLARIGFILSSENLPGAAVFSDSYNEDENPSELRISYVPPR